MSNERITSRFFVMVLVAAGCGFSSIEENPGYCVNNGGDRFCELRGDDRIYCSMGTPGCPAQAEQAYDGCVDDEPDPSCYSPCGDGTQNPDEDCVTEAMDEEQPDDPPLYLDCQGDDQCPGDQLCYEDFMPGHDFCTIECSIGGDCPGWDDGVSEVPEARPARPSCPTGLYFCVLDCSGGRQCPEGMDCVQLDSEDGPRAQRCAWPNST